MDDMLRKINAEIEKAKEEVGEIEAEQAGLIELGMYQQVPRVEWQSRNGSDANYMYLVFTMDQNGKYPSPKGKRKQYIGANYRKQQHAAVKIDRRQRWERLERKRIELERWASRKNAECLAIINQLQAIYKKRHNWQQFKISERDRAT